MPGQASPHAGPPHQAPSLSLPTPVAAAIGVAAVTAAGIGRTARSVAGPLWTLAHRLPGAAAPIDATLGLLAQTGSDVTQRAAALAETLTRAVLRAALPIVFDELAANERLDLTALVLQRVDLDAIAAEIDLEAIIARLDLDAVVHQVDLLGLANEIIDGVNLTEIIRESTGALSTDAVRGVRSRGVDADSAVSGFVDRLLGRDPAPPQPAPDQPAPEQPSEPRADS